MKNILLIVSGFILLTAFNTRPVLLTDYRDAYTGTYFCTRLCSSLKTEGGGRTTKIDTISIIVSKDVKDSILQINLGQQVLKVRVANKKMRTISSNYRYFAGTFFAKDSINFSFIPALSISYNYIGKRK